jgi:hypothetical protein
MARHVDPLLCIPRAQEDSSRPFWANDWFPPFDGASLYGLIAERSPPRYIEVGSGISTRFARQAISDLDLQTRIVSIDPHPHTVIDTLCDEVVHSRMEDVPREFWEGIGPEDLLFVDNSHRSFPNSDVTVFFAEVMPRIAARNNLGNARYLPALGLPGGVAEPLVQRIVFAADLFAWRRAWRRDRTAGNVGHTPAATARNSGVALGARRPVPGPGNAWRLLLDAARHSGDLLIAETLAA